MSAVVEMITVFEWTGSILGLLGAFLLATNSRVSQYGWIAFLAGNIAWIAFSIKVGTNGLLLQQLGLMGTNILGLYRVGLWPKRTAKSLVEVPIHYANAREEVNNGESA